MLHYLILDRGASTVAIWYLISGHFGSNNQLIVCMILFLFPTSLCFYLMQSIQYSISGAIIIVSLVKITTGVHVFWLNL